MKECAFCGGDVNDDAITCPHCSATEFKNKCPLCGRAIEGTVCPHCAAERRRAEAEAQAQAQAARAEQAAAETANTGLGWKTALTVFLPFVGGYFLIKDKVRPGFKIFAIIWCSFMAISVASVDRRSASGNILAVLMCLGPIGWYLFKARNRLLGGGEMKGKIWYIGFAALLAYTVIGAAASAGRTPEIEPAAESTTPTRTMTTNAQDDAARENDASSASSTTP